MMAPIFFRTKWQVSTGPPSGAGRAAQGEDGLFGRMKRVTGNFP